MRVLRVAAVAVGALLVASLAFAQFGFRFGFDASIQSHMAKPDSHDGKWHYCRAVYRNNPVGDGGGWLTDYPLADRDLSVRLSELTKTWVSFDEGGQPRHLIVRLTDDELFQCPFIMMQEVGRLLFTPEDASRLRTYLLKGGFLWVDDFWGSYAWRIWETEIRKVFPAADYPIVDLQPDHPIFRTMFNVKAVPQIPAINFWEGTGGTSERGPDSAVVHTRGISDSHGRLMVLMTHNTDVSDSWEREGEDPRYFFTFSVYGYQVAVNVLLYSMTH